MTYQARKLYLPVIHTVDKCTEIQQSCADLYLRVSRTWPAILPSISSLSMATIRLGPIN